METDALKRFMQVEEESGSYHFKKNICENSKCPRIAVAREEFVDLTQDPFIAMILNQLLYWSQRVKDFDLFVEEEKTRNTDQEEFLQYGWFYKSALELSEETLLRVTKVTMRKYLHVLVENGWISERSNPLNRWDKTSQYRVNLKKLQEDLQKLGWTLPGFSKDIFTLKVQKVNIEEKKTPSLQNQQIPACLENEPSKESFLTLESKKNEPSKVEKLNFIYLTETTSKNTNREHTQRTGAREEKNFSEKSFFEKVLEIWNTCLNQNVHLTDERQRAIHSLFPFYFENDLNQWKAFCERVTDSSFLMGNGPRKWRVSLDWILVEENLLKVLEGNFDEEKGRAQKSERIDEGSYQKEIHSVLASIEEPVWKEWCSQLNFSPDSHESVSLMELKSIANAKFLEVEDERLVWVVSSDAYVLSKIEELRLKILPVVQGTFPHIRTVRTRLMSEKDSSHQVEIPDPPRIPVVSNQHKGDALYA